MITIWTKAFGAEHICAWKNVTTKLEKHLSNYKRIVYGSKYQKQSKRERIKIWRSENSSLLNLLRSNVNPADFEDHERRFFEMQNSPSREGYISEEIDIDYEERIAEKKLQQESEAQAQHMEHSDESDQENPPENETSLLNCITCSRKVRTSFESSIQTDPVKLIERPAIRTSKHYKVSSDEIKTTLAKVSSTAHITAPKATVAFQVVAK